MPRWNGESYSPGTLTFYMIICTLLPFCHYIHKVGCGTYFVYTLRKILLYWWTSTDRYVKPILLHAHFSSELPTISDDRSQQPHALTITCTRPKVLYTQHLHELQMLISLGRFLLTCWVRVPTSTNERPAYGSMRRVQTRCRV
jgi:hypothetical protein